MVNWRFTKKAVYNASKSVILNLFQNLILMNYKLVWGIESDNWTQLKALRFTEVEFLDSGF